jgi:hypothetical protein
MSSGFREWAEKEISFKMGGPGGNQNAMLLNRVPAPVRIENKKKEMLRFAFCSL